VLNSIAKAVVDELRGNHPEYVFTYRGKPIKKMNDLRGRKPESELILLM
jgi:hypothetical protein